MKPKKLSKIDRLELFRQAELMEAITRREIETQIRGCIGQLETATKHLCPAADCATEIEAAMKVAGTAA